MLTLGPGYSWVPYKNSANFFSRLYQDINLNIYKYYHRALLYNKIEVPTFYKIHPSAVFYDFTQYFMLESTPSSASRLFM